MLCTPSVAQAIYEGRQTQDRRIVTPQPDPATQIYRRYEHFEGAVGGMWLSEVDADRNIIPGKTKACTRWAKYQPGDVLYVREAFRVFMGNDPRIEYRDGSVGFEGDERCYLVKGITAQQAGEEMEAVETGDPVRERWKPSIHMPAWAARSFLEVTAVRCERVQEISEADARAEGCDPLPLTDDELKNYKVIEGAHPSTRVFSWLWDSIHGPGAWERNDWVWVYEFRKTEKP